ncbi:MAG: hypothetical protein MUC83_18465 [Pirellula sp.]|nr:hypothetical protein [Pirellula sp.]
MKIKSLESTPIRPESADDRRLAIRNSWTLEETEHRHQIASELQLLLNIIARTSNEDTQNTKPTRKLIRIDGPRCIGEERFPRLSWIDRSRNKQFDWELCPV